MSRRKLNRIREANNSLILVGRIDAANNLLNKKACDRNIIVQCFSDLSFKDLVTIHRTLDKTIKYTEHNNQYLTEVIESILESK